MTSGGETIKLEIFEYDTSSVLVSTNNYTFVDNNDGTYSANFTANQEGSIEYNIYFISSCTACTYYWSNKDLIGEYEYFCNYDDINRNFGQGPIVGSLSD